MSDNLKIPMLGHNNPPEDFDDDFDDQPSCNGVAGERLKSFIERIERYEEEKRAIADDIKEIYSEVKSAGFEAKIIRKMVKLRKMEIEVRREEDELLDLYMSAIGMV